MNGPEDIAQIDIPPHMKSVPLEWKPEIAERPVLRRAEKREYGWTTSATAGLGASYLLQQTERLARDAGFEQHVTLYALRRGAGNAVNSECSMLYPLYHSV